MKEVNIHELIQTVKVGYPIDDGLSDFLVNDVEDPNFDPDTLYFSQGGTAPVAVVTDITASLTDFSAQLSADTPDGWVYLRLFDPLDGQFPIEKVLRSDGGEVKIDKLRRI